MNIKTFFKSGLIALCVVALFSTIVNAAAAPSKKALRNYLNEHSLVVVKDGQTYIFDVSTGNLSSP